jgi:dTDP-4-amino-4,6-dideoxygalactose transaminase
LAGVVDMVLPFVPKYAEPVWHLYVIRSKQRNTLKAHLEKYGISTVIHYPIPPHKQTCYEEFKAFELPIADVLAEEVLSLPISPAMTDDEVEFVARVILIGLNKKAHEQ